MKTCWRALALFLPLFSAPSAFAVALTDLNCAVSAVAQDKTYSETGLHDFFDGGFIGGHGAEEILWTELDDSVAGSGQTTIQSEYVFVVAADPHDSTQFNFWTNIYDCHDGNAYREFFTTAFAAPLAGKPFQQTFTVTPACENGYLKSATVTCALSAQ